MSHTLGLGQIEKELDLAGPRAVIAQVQEEVNKSSCQKFVKMGTFSESPLEEKAIILQNDFISKYSSLSSGKAFTFYGLQSLKAYRVLVCFQMGEYSFSSPFPIQYAETDFITYSEKDFFFFTLGYWEVQRPHYFSCLPAVQSEQVHRWAPHSR